jgi:hypothetical protein
MSPLLPWMIVCSIALALTSLLELIPDQSKRTKFEGGPSKFLAILKAKWLKIFLSALLGGISVWLTVSNSRLSGQQSKAYLDSLLIPLKGQLTARDLSYDTLTRKLIATKTPELLGFDATSSNNGIINESVDSLIYYPILKNTGNCQELLNLKVYLGFICKGKLQTLTTPIGFTRYQFAANPVGIKFPISLHYTIKPTTVYFLLQGSYSSAKDTSNKLPIDILLEWDIQRNEVGTPINPQHIDRISSEIKRKLNL